MAADVFKNGLQIMGKKLKKYKKNSASGVKIDRQLDGF